MLSPYISKKCLFSILALDEICLIVEIWVKITFFLSSEGLVPLHSGVWCCHLEFSCHWNGHWTLYFLSEHFLVILFAPSILKFQVDIHCCGSIFILCSRMDLVNSVVTSTLSGWEFFYIIDLGSLPSMFSILSFWSSLLVHSEPTKLILFSFLSSFPSVLLVCFLGHSLKFICQFYWIFIFYFPGDFLHLSFNSPEHFVLAAIFKTLLLPRTLSCPPSFPLCSCLHGH